MKITYGHAVRSLNPEVPVSLAGYFNKRMWTGVLDDLAVRALVLRHKGATAVLAQCDLVTITAELYDQVLAELIRNGLDAGRHNLILCATHTHTAPEVRPGKPGANPAYLPFAASQIAAAIGAACSMATDGILCMGLAHDHRFSFNRRYWMRDGRVKTNPGKLNPDILRPEGEVDFEIPLLAIKDAGGVVRVLLANIVNHSDCIGGSLVSADWPGFFIRALQDDFGAGALVLPLVGCAGNINHFDVSHGAPQTSYAEAERIGRGYAESVRQTLASLTPVTGAGLRVVSANVTSAPREISAEERQAAQAVLDRFPEIDVASGNAAEDLTSEDLARGTPYALKYFAWHLLKAAENDETPVFHLTGFSAGDIAIVSMPCEPFAEIGLILRKEIFAGKALCLVTEHGNGTGGRHYYGGYIPNMWNYGRGGYEDTPRSNPFAQATAPLLLAAWRELARRL